MKKKYWVAGIMICAVLAGGVFAAKKFNPLSGPKVTVSDVKLRGNPAAPVEIIEYSDFQCPACGRTQAYLEHYMNSYPGQVKIIFRHFPLPMHRWAALAHQAAECANMNGKFWEYHDLLYKEQAVWSVALNPMEIFFQYAGRVQIPLESFASCLSDKSVFERILKEKRSGEELKITSTPTLFINGERIVGPFEAEARGENAVRRVLGMQPLPPKPAAQVPASPGIPAMGLAAPPPGFQPGAQGPSLPAAPPSGSPAVEPGHEGHNH